jgi:hypothetical protein
LSIACGSDIQRKLKLLYCLHLPGVVHPWELQQSSEEQVVGGTPGRHGHGGDTAEMASEADDYFSTGDEAIGQTVKFVKEQSVDSGDDFGEEDTTSLGSIQSILMGDETRAGRRKIPPLPQQHFVLLWKTLYSLFMGLERSKFQTDEQQQLYHSVSLVGTLLLQIGEVGLKFDKRKSSPDLKQLKISETCSGDVARSSGPSDHGKCTVASSSGPSDHGDQKPVSTQSSESIQGTTTTTAVVTLTTTSTTTTICDNLQSDDTCDRTTAATDKTTTTTDNNNKKSSNPESQGGARRKSRGAEYEENWAITFEQFLASILTEPPLVQFFSKQNSIQEPLENYSKSAYLKSEP